MHKTSLNDKDHLICKLTLYCCFMLAHQTMNILLTWGLLSWILRFLTTIWVTPKKTIWLFCGGATTFKSVIGHDKTPKYKLKRKLFLKPPKNLELHSSFLMIPAIEFYISEYKSNLKWITTYIIPKTFDIKSWFICGYYIRE